MTKLTRQIFRKKPISHILSDSARGTTGLRVSLRLRDLVALAIAAIIGAGIFSTIGNASAQGGPAVSLLFIFTALACTLSALCYADFASRIPISGSAYTYAYASMGELVAWVIGWDLLLEYAVGNIAVAISWSDYFQGFLTGFGIYLPSWMCMDYASARAGFVEATAALQQGIHLDQMPFVTREGWQAWVNAPRLGSIPIIADIPAFLIVALITYLVYVGIRETKTASNIMVGIKVLAILLVIVVGAFHVNPGNWSPFAPHGFSGVLKGVGAVFFAYIGFDAISTTAEECRDPQRDLPRAMILSLLICAFLYVLIALVLTGITHYSNLAVGDPLAHVFQELGLSWFSGIIAFSAIIAMAGVLLVFQVGQPRIWMSMSRDGLMPARFSRIHPKYKTPAFATIITGLVVGIPCLFMNLHEVTELSSIGTLFAFTIVCAGVLNRKSSITPGARFKLPYINASRIMPLLLAVGIGLLFTLNRENTEVYIEGILSGNVQVIKTRIPLLIFVFTAILITVLSAVKKYSLIPVLGVLTNLFLMAQIEYQNWERFMYWILAGIVVYFLYSVHHSKLQKSIEKEE